MVKKISICVTLALGGFLEAGAQLAHQYTWSFPEGNLISNWSFERDADETCMPSTGSPFDVTDCKFKIGGTPSGDFAMKVKPGAVSSGQSPSTDFLRIVPSATYAFSVWVKGLWDADNTGQTAPVLEFFTEGKASIGNPVELDPYESALDVSTPDWNRYEDLFQAPANAAFMKVRLLKVLSLQKTANTFYFDNLLLQSASGKMGVLESRSFEDAAGNAEQSVVGDGQSDIVTFTAYDSIRRPSRLYVPVPVKMAAPSGNFSQLAVGTRIPGENLNYDFPTLTEAYTSLRDWAMTLPASQITPVVLHVVVDSSNPEAPLGVASGQEYQALTSQDGQHVPLDIIGIFRGSSAYDSLIAVHGPPIEPAPVSTEYVFANLFPSAYQAQYPGDTTFYSEYAYPSPGENTFTEAAMPGRGYALATGHTDKSGWALVDSTTNTAATPEVAGPAASAGTSGLFYQWVRDRQGQYAMSLFNPEGLLMHSGQRLGGQWNEADFGYDSFNRATSTFSPAGVLTTAEYDGQNRTTQALDPDRGQTDFLYDDFGRLRFVHPAEIGTPTAMVAHKYDAAGRLVQSGTTAYDWDETKAEDSQTYPGTNLETGRIYDAFTMVEWQAKTGVPWSTLGINLAVLKNGKSKIAAVYNKNPECTAPGFIASPDRRLAASLYSYDSLGRLETQFKWIGAAEIPSDRIQKITYTYDDLGRLAMKQVFATGLGNLVVNAQRFEYDADGRVQTVFDKDSRAMITYAYNNLGQVKEAKLYGKFKLNWTYSIRGELRKIEAITLGSSPEYIFSEELGYEEKSNPDLAVPAPTVPQYNGSISSILRKFSKDVTGSVELSQYQYDDLGRLFQADRVTAGPKTPSFPVLNNDGSINFSNLSFLSNSSTETEEFNYDADGALTSQTRPGTGMHDYTFHGTASDPTHKVKDVSGNRATGAPLTVAGGNFRYDSQGRMTDDIGSQKHFTYGFASDRVVIASVPGRTFHMLYDENLNRVAELEVNSSGDLLGSKVTVYESGLVVTKEFIFRSPAHPLGGAGIVKNALMGAGGLLGFENQATGQKKLLLKDHQGSTVKVLDEATGNYAGQEEYAYWAYGILNKKAVVPGDMKPSETFTGKEYEDALALYYFGARWYDPELGMWLSPDPAEQFSNPYAYGGDPINSVDPDGRYVIWDDIVVAVVGAAVGSGVALSKGYNPLDWQFHAYSAAGAAIAWTSYYTGGATGSAVSAWATGAGASATEAAVVGGAAGGAVAGAIGSGSNYLASSGIETGFSNFNGEDFWQANWTGGAAGAAGGAVGGSGVLGKGAINAFGAGFTGGFTGAAANGASLRTSVNAGLLSGSIGAGVYSVNCIHSPYPKASYGTSKVTGERGVTPQEAEISRDFRAFRASQKKDYGALSESGATYRDANFWDRWWHGSGTIIVRTNAKSSVGGSVSIEPGLGDDYQVHSHPAVPGSSTLAVSGLDGDVGQALNYPDVKFYMWADELSQQQMYQYTGQFDFIHLTGY